MKSQGDIQCHNIKNKTVTAAGFDPALPAISDSVFKFK